MSSYSLTGHDRYRRTASIQDGIAGRLRKVGVEIKFSSAPKPTKGFWHALQDLQIDRACVIAPVPRRYPLAAGVEVMPVGEIGGVLG